MADNSIDTGEIINNSLNTADIAGTDVNGGLISFSAGSVANGRCEDHPVATGGAMAGEAALITTQGALQQGMFRDTLVLRRSSKPGRSAPTRRGGVQ